MATSEPGKFCQMAASLLPKEMHIKDEPLTIREVRHVIVEAIKAGDKAIEQTKSRPLKTNQIEMCDITL
jgi:hypothetical protein